LRVPAGGETIPGDISAEVPMPAYDYLCHACKKTFNQILTIAEHDHSKIKCPHCGSKDVEQKYSAFYAVTSKKSA
jgi:putative FmdB family regulatory protein